MISGETTYVPKEIRGLLSGFDPSISSTNMLRQKIALRRCLFKMSPFSPGSSYWHYKVYFDRRAHDSPLWAEQDP